MLPQDIDRLVRAAEDARTAARAGYSGFSVGAAVMTAGGKIYRGCNIENPSLMMSVCAEKAALINALVEGEDLFTALVVVSDDGRYCFPCGSCRQMLAEFGPSIELYLASDKGIKKYSIPELLPHMFRK